MNPTILNQQLLKEYRDSFRFVVSQHSRRQRWDSADTDRKAFNKTIWKWIFIQTLFLSDSIYFSRSLAQNGQMALRKIMSHIQSSCVHLIIELASGCWSQGMLAMQKNRRRLTWVITGTSVALDEHWITNILPRDLISELQNQQLLQNCMLILSLSYLSLCWPVLLD